MFDNNSRYYSLEDARLTAKDGTITTYKKRRFLPDSSQMQIVAEVKVAQGDRLDLMASRTLGDPEQFWRICDANNAMNPKDLLVVGRVVQIALPQP
jgi:hypothetical protein